MEKTKGTSTVIGTEITTGYHVQPSETILQAPGKLQGKQPCKTSL